MEELMVEVMDHTITDTQKMDSPGVATEELEVDTINKIEDRLKVEVDTIYKVEHLIKENHIRMLRRRESVNSVRAYATQLVIVRKKSTTKNMKMRKKTISKET